MAPCLHIDYPTIGLYHLVQINVIKYKDHLKCIDIQLMLVKICPDKSMKWSTHYLHILTNMNDTSTMSDHHDSLRH